MAELPFEYWNKLANQFVLMSVFLGGFSIALTANLIINKSEDRIYNALLKLATTSSGGFLTSVFAMTNILLFTTEGYPGEISQEDLNTPRVIGFLGFLIGFFSLLGIIGFSGWTKSKRVGIFTTTVSIITLILFWISVT